MKISDLQAIVNNTRSLSGRDEKLSYLYTWDRDTLNFLAGNITKDGIAKAIASEIPISKLNKSMSDMEYIVESFSIASTLLRKKDKINQMQGIWLTKKDRNFVLTCLYGSLKLGVKIPIPDPIFGEIIKPQLCGTGIKFNPKKYIIEEKFDGIRCIATNNNGVITLQSRNGKILNVPVIVKSLMNILPSGTTVDGEIVASNGEFQSLDRYSINLIYQIFDIIFYKNQKIIGDLSFRKDFINRYIIENNNIKISPILCLNRMCEIDDWINSYNNVEGIVAKDPNSLYQYGDRKAWIKLKPFLDCTCDVINYTEGIGKRKGIMGSINVTPMGSSQVTKVGSGFTDIQLIEMKQLIDDGNKITVDIKFQNWTTDGCLRFPVFLRIREINNEEI